MSDIEYSVITSDVIKSFDCITPKKHSYKIIVTKGNISKTTADIVMLWTKVRDVLKKKMMSPSRENIKTTTV